MKEHPGIRIRCIIMVYVLMYPMHALTQIVASDPDSQASQQSGGIDLSGAWIWYDGTGCDKTSVVNELEVTIQHQNNLMSITMDSECKDNKWYNGKAWVTGNIPNDIQLGEPFILSATRFNRNGSVAQPVVLTCYLHEGGNLIVVQSSNWKTVTYIARGG